LHLIMQLAVSKTALFSSARQRCISEL